MTLWREPLKAPRVIAAILLAGAVSLFAQSHGREAEFDTDLSQAVAAQTSGDAQGAIAAYQKALVLRPSAAEIWSNLGLMQHQIGDTAGALKSFSAAHRLQPKLFVPVLFLGVENLESKRPEEAIPYLKQADALNPKDANVTMYLGRAYFAMKDFDAAATAFSRAAELNPKSGEPKYRLGLAQFQLAETDSRELSTQHRGSPYFLALEADALSSQQKLARAATIYGDLLGSHAKPPCILSGLGLVLLQEGKLDEAEDRFREDERAGGCSFSQLGMLRIEFEKSGANANLSLLKELWKTDQGWTETYLPLLGAGLPPDRFTLLDEAFDRTNFGDLAAEDIAHMKTALHGALSTDDREDYTGARGITSAKEHFLRGEYRACEDRLLQTHVLLSGESLSMLAACSLFTGDFKVTLSEASKLKRISGTGDEGLYWSIRARQALGVRALVEAGQTEPDSIRIHELLAETYRDMGRSQDAETEYAAALHIDPNSFSALIGAAANYLQEYRLDPAGNAIQRALALKPDDPEANYIAGEILVDQHRFEEAEPHLKIGLSAKPELLSRVHALLGRVYVAKGEDNAAIEELKLGLPSDDDGSIHFQLGRLYQKAGEQKLAEVEFAETRRLQNKQ